jgi:hypothetical protein
VLKEPADTPPGVQALEASGTVTAADYAAVFAPIITRLRRNGDRLRLLYQFGPDFERLTLGALWADTRLGIGYLPILDGCALVSDIEWIREPTRSLGAWLPCPMRVYDNDRRDDAAAWLASLPQGGGRPSTSSIVKAYVGGSAAATASLAKIVVSESIQHSRSRN